MIGERLRGGAVVKFSLEPQGGPYIPIPSGPNVKVAEVPAMLQTGWRLENRGSHMKYGLNVRYHLPVAVSLRDSVYEPIGTGKVNRMALEPMERPILGWVIAYRVFNLGGNCDGIEGSPIDASFFMTNVTNKAWSESVLPSCVGVGIRNGRCNEPRMYGVSLAYRFGE